MALWEELASAVEDKLNQANDWANNNPTINEANQWADQNIVKPVTNFFTPPTQPTELGADQTLDTSPDTAYVPEQPIYQPSDSYSLPSASDLVSAVEEKLKPTLQTVENMAIPQGLVRNAVNDVANKTSQWYEGAKQGLAEAQQANEANNQINPLTSEEYLGINPPQQETQEQQQVKEWASKANTNFLNETVKPAAYAAGLAMPEVAAPFMIGDFVNGVNQQGLGKTIGDFTGINATAKALDNPEEFFNNLSNEPITTAAEFLPAYLTGRLALKGSRKAIGQAVDYAKSGETAGFNYTTEHPADPISSMKNESDFITTDPITGVVREKTPEEIKNDQQSRQSNTDQHMPYLFQPSNTANTNQNSGSILEQIKNALNNERGSFGGIRAKNADIGTLVKAENLENQGFSNEDIRQSTGWYRGMDGKWRFEIDDSGSTFKNSTDFSNDLPEVLNHPNLYDAYPALKDTRVIMAELPDDMSGAYDRNTNEIVLNSKLSDTDMKETLLHEVQHAIQQQENFARGGNPGTMFPDQAAQSPIGEEGYQNLAGEIEARDTMNRSNLSQGERKSTPPDLQDNAIVTFDSGANYLKDKISPEQIRQQLIDGVEAKISQQKAGEKPSGADHVVSDLSYTSTSEGLPLNPERRLASPTDTIQQISENIKHGNEAMEHVITNQTDSIDAMQRPDLGSITFYWGNKKTGVKHIIDRRTAQGYNGEAIARKMVDVIAHGEPGEIYGPPGGERVNVSHDGHTAVLSLYKYGDRQTWLLTGWENYREAPGAANGGNGPFGATHSEPMRTRPGVGAETSVTNNIQQDSNLFNGKEYNITSDDLVKAVEEKLKQESDPYANNTPPITDSEIGRGTDPYATDENPYGNPEQPKKPNPLTSGFIAQDVAPLANDIKTTAQSIKSFLSPASVNDHTRAVADTIRDYNSSQKIDYLQAEKGLEEAQKYFAKMPVEQQKQMLIDYQEGNLNDPTLKPIVDAMKNTTGNTWLDLVEMGKNKDFEEWFLPQAWESTPQNGEILRKWRQNVMNSPTGWLNKKVVPSYREGMRLGLEPADTNPVDAILHREVQARRWIMGEKIKQELEGTGELKFVKPGEPIPDEGGKWKAIQGEDNPLGPNAKGAYFARPEVANLINNFLNKGWQNAPWYQRYMQVANTMNQFQLLGGFHIGFTSFDSVVSKLTLMPKLATDAAQNMVNGNFKKAAGNIADALITTPGPTTPFTTAWKGRRFIKDLVNKDKINDPLVQAYRAGGGQIGLAKEFTTKYWTGLRKAWVNGNYVGAGIRLPFAAAERLSGLILDKVVPWQKAGVFTELMKYELKRDPSLINNRPRLRSAAAKVIDTIDNRLGQVNWDNLFLKPEFKQSLFVFMRAPGWTGGTIREMGGGVLDAAHTVSRLQEGGPLLTHRMAYDIALPIASIAAGYVGQTLLTGQTPDMSKEAGSLFFKFKNGQKDEWGNDKYSSMPSYMKDLHAWYKQPFDTVISKQHPMLSVLSQIIRNRDYYGTEIRHPDDDTLTQGRQIANYTLKQFQPFSIRNAAQQMGDKGFLETLKDGTMNDRLQALLPQIGVNPTPKDISMTEAQKAARELMMNKLPMGSRTQEQTDKTQLKAQLRKDVIGQSKVPESVLEAVRNGQISKDEGRNIWEQRNKQPLQREVAADMSLDDAMKIWSKSTDEEKEQIRTAIVKKISNVIHNDKATSEQRQKALQYYYENIKR